MAKRRGHNEGTLYQRSCDGRWVGQVSIGIDPATGRNKRATFYGKTKKEVQEQVHEALLQLKAGTFAAPNKVTVGEWLDHWLNVYAKNKVRPSTWENYSIVVNAHIKPGLGNIALRNLRSSDIQQFYNHKLEAGKRHNQGGLSPRSVNYMHSILNMALKQAVKEQLIVRNPAEAVNKPKQVRHEFKPLTVEEMNKFLMSAREHRLFPAFMVEWGAGLRRGELLGLKWEDIDLKKGTLTVKRSLIRVNHKLAFTEPKTAKSRRTIPLPAEVVFELKSWKAKQAQEKLMAGQAYQDHGLVFCSALGTPVDPRDMNRLFDKLLKKAGLPKVRFHDLRHTHATMLLALGEHPKVVQERLGHSTIAMTLDTYSHLVPGIQEAAAMKLSTILNIKEKTSHTEG